MKKFPTLKRIENDLKKLIESYEFDDMKFVEAMNCIHNLAFSALQIMKLEAVIQEKNENSPDGVGGLIIRRKDKIGTDSSRMSPELVALSQLKADYLKYSNQIWKIIKDSRAAANKKDKDKTKVNPLDGFLTQYKDE